MIYDMVAIYFNAPSAMLEPVDQTTHIHSDEHVGM